MKKIRFQLHQQLISFRYVTENVSCINKKNTDTNTTSCSFIEKEMSIENVGPTDYFRLWQSKSKSRNKSEVGHVS